MTFTVWHIAGACAVVALVTAVLASVRTRQKDIRKVAQSALTGRKKPD